MDHSIFTLQRMKRRLRRVDRSHYVVKVSITCCECQGLGYMAHSSASSASEMNGSSIALIARSPQRILCTVLCQKTNSQRSRRFTIGQQPERPTPFPPFLSSPLAQSALVIRVSFPSRSIHFHPKPSSQDSHYETRADNSERQRIAY